MFEISRTIEFIEWLESLPRKHRSQVHERIQKIKYEGYFGTTKQLTKELWELKWKIGWRVYYIYIDITSLLIVFGGNKNGQEKDIKKALNIVEKYKDTHS